VLAFPRRYPEFIRVLELEMGSRYSMTVKQTPSRRVTVVIFVTLACVVSTLLVASWMSELIVPIMMTEQLSIADVHFGEGYMTLEVSVGEESMPVKIGEVRVTELNQTYYNQLTDRVVNATINELVPQGEHVIIIICNEWVSGYTYQIRLTSSRGNQFTQYAVAP